MNLAAPGWLLLLPLTAALAVGVAFAGLAHRRRLGRVLSGPMLARVLPASVRRRRLLRDAAALAGLAGIALALAEPRFDKVVQTVQSRGTDVVLLLDLSRSMDARDVDPSRLERARREIADLGRLIEGDRVGLVLFAGGAYPRLPLTADFRAVELVASEVDTESFTTQGSDLGAALRVALELLSRSEEQAGQALLVLSDGETHDPDDALAAANEAADRGIPVFVMGIGVEAAPIPTRDGRPLSYKGEEVRTAPDFEILKQVAKVTGGAFVSSNASSRDMEGLYGELRGAVRAVQRSSHQREQWRSAFQWPLSLAAGLLLLSAWVGDGRRAFGAATALAAALLLASSPAFAQDPLAEADRLYREGRYPQAVEKLVELTLESAEDPALFDRLGAARYRAGDFEGAARAWEQAAELRGGDADALYNSGNAHYRAGRLDRARERYDQALERAPDHPGAAANRQLVEQELMARRQPKPPPPPKPGEGEKQGEGGQGDQQEPSAGQGQGDQEDGEQEGEGPDGPPQQGEGEPAPAGRPGPGEDGSDPNRGETRDPQADQGSGGTSDLPPEDQGSEAVDPSAVGEAEPGAEGEDAAAAGGGGVEGGGEGPITAGQAERLLESVEEGSPRTVVQGRPEGKPW